MKKIWINGGWGLERVWKLSKEGEISFRIFLSWSIKDFFSSPKLERFSCYTFEYEPRSWNWPCQKSWKLTKKVTLAAGHIARFLGALQDHTRNIMACKEEKVKHKTEKTTPISRVISSFSPQGSPTGKNGDFFLGSYASSCHPFAIFGDPNQPPFSRRKTRIIAEEAKKYIPPQKWNVHTQGEGRNSTRYLLKSLKQQKCLWKIKIAFSAVCAY